MLSRLRLPSAAAAALLTTGACRLCGSHRAVIRVLSSAKPQTKSQPLPPSASSSSASASSETTPPTSPQPHRGRPAAPQQQKRQQQQQPFPLANASISDQQSSQQPELMEQQRWLALDRDIAHPSVYLALSKSRLTLLIVATAAAGYAMAPGPLQPASLAACLAGTALASAAANTVNQLLEVPYDAQMARTRARPLVTGRVSPGAAAAFACISGTAGVGLLAGLASPLSGALAAANVLLYCAAYTPAKRRTVSNTALGAVVGAIPPLIGWSAATGGSLELGALLLGALMFAWQFPHFHALSWALRDDYSRAGYCMASVLQPERCRRSALLNSALFSAVCYCLPACGLTSWSFLVDSLPFNAALLYFAAAFYWRGDSNSGRRLFRFTLLNLPVIFVLMFISRTPDSERERCAPGGEKSGGSEQRHHQFIFWRD